MAAKDPHNHSLTRRRFLQLAGLTSAASILASCSPTPAPSPTQASGGAQSPSGAQAPTAAQPAVSAPKGQLTVAQGADADTMDPQKSSSSATFGILLNIHDTLLTRDHDGKLQPGLATSYRSTDDTTWEVKLREGVKFHNGEPFDADAVKFSIDRTLDPNTGSVFLATLGTISTVEVVDPLTVRIVTKAPDPIFPARLCMDYGMMLAPKYAQQVGPDGLAKKPIGAGPFKFVEWVKDDHVTLEAVPDNWRKPKVATVVFQPIPEGATRVAAAKTGAADIVAAIPPADFASIKSGDKTTGIEITSNRAFLLNLDTIKFKPFQDKRVRQAMNYAVDVDSIIKNTLNGYGKRIATSVIPEAFGYDPSIAPYPYDPEKAKQLLTDAGYPNGFEVGFDTTDGRYPQDKEIATVVAGQLAKVGVKVNVQAFEWGAYYDGVKAKTRAPIFDIGMSTELFDADNTFSLHFHSGTIWSRWNNPQFDQLVDTARATMDPAKRQQLLSQAGKIQHDEAPMIFLHQITYLYGVNKRVQGWQPSNIEEIVVWDISVS